MNNEQQNLAGTQPVVQPAQQIPQQNIIQPVPVPPKKKRGGIIFLLLIILGMTGYIFYTKTLYKKGIEQMKLDCTPVSTEKDAKELPLDSTIVKELYSKVETTIREDLASPTIDDTMKLYLAYRQLANNQIYDSNCNLFSNTNMNPYICATTDNFIPTAFKEETLQQEVKKLFGEKTIVNNANIQLGTSCIGGYQYIKERGEYVQGYCAKDSATAFRVEKQLVKAISKQSTIILTEKVIYYGSEGVNVPEALRNGTYNYTFRLDPNYNYIYISKCAVVNDVRPKR